MDEEHLKKQLDKLWEKVKETPSGSNREESVSAFELAQSEIHAETLRALQQRFEKEKKYWENLVTAKDEAVARLEKEVQEQNLKTNRLRDKIQELQSEQTGIIQQSFSTLEIQKRSLNNHIHKLEEDLESARKETLMMRLDLEEERVLRQKMKGKWDEEEQKWRDEVAHKELEVENTKREIFSKRETELEDIAKLEETAKKLKRQLADDKTLYETEKAGLQNLVNEKQAQIQKLNADLSETVKRLDNEKEERRLAAVEREKVTIQSEEDRKRMTEQMLAREVKVRELEQTVERMTKERMEREESLRIREEKILHDEETVRRRREDWVDSVRSQASQELNISEKSVDLLSKLESKLGLRPPVIPHAQNLTLGRPPSIHKDADANLEAIAEKYPSFKSGVLFLRKRESWVLVFAGLLLFILTSTLLVFESQGRRSVRAQALLMKGNEQFTKGNLENSLKQLEKAYDLDPSNTIIRNSLTLVLGELATKEKRDGKLDLALKRVEALYQILPEDPDVVRLHGEILQALGRGPVNEVKEPAPAPVQEQKPEQTILPAPEPEPQPKAETPSEPQEKNPEETLTPEQRDVN